MRRDKILLAMVALAIIWFAGGCVAAAQGFPRGVPMFPQIEEGPFNPQHPKVTGDTLSPLVQAAIQYQSQINPGVGAAGAIVLLCWKDVEPAPDHWNFGAKAAPSSLEILGDILAPGQSLIIGLKGGTCAPDWLTRFGVAMPDNFLNKYDGCQPMTLPASYMPQYVNRYLKATQALWNALGRVKLRKDPSQSLQDRVIAIRNGAMVSFSSGEMGIFSQGCKGPGGVMQSQYDVAKIWVQNGYTPDQAKTAYANILQGIFKITAARPRVAISQSVLGNDRYAFPLVNNAGVAYPPPASPQDNSMIVPMFGPILDAAAEKYGTKVIFGFNELAVKGARETIPPPGNVVEAGRHGAGIEWQLNGNGHTAFANQVTSCGGHADPRPATVACFNAIMNYAVSPELVPAQSNGGHLEWVEFWPGDVISPNPMF